MRRLFKSLAVAVALALAVPTITQAAGTTNGFALTGEQAVLNGLFRTTGAFTGRPAMHLGFFTTCPSTDEGTGGTEVSTTNTGYGRTALTQADANWDAATATSPSMIENTGTLTVSAWTPSGAGLPVTINCWGIWDGTTEGGDNLLIWGALTTPKTINSGDAQPTFADGVLEITLD
jgi:hypothetical protein